MYKQCIVAGVVFIGLVILPAFLLADDIPLAQENIVKMGVDFTWTEKHTCRGPSPKIKVSNVPSPVLQFTVYLRDMTKPGYFHGGGIVQKRYNKIIKEGELKSYYGPCFTDGPPRKFVMRVYGLDVDGRVVAYGEKILPFPID
ncbi:hypothetical protein KJ966_18665 [bacterium]|nr:hypothetical protein [bacterium]